jgi:hypothetical protein
VQGLQGCLNNPFSRSTKKKKKKKKKEEIGTKWVYLWRILKTGYLNDLAIPAHVRFNIASNH